MTDQSSRPQQPGTVAARRRSSPPSWRCSPRSAFEDIGFAEIARRAGVSLSELRVKHSSKIEMLAAHMREVDRAVLDGIDAGMADEPPRERLFDVLMRRLDLLAPDKAAVQSLQRSVMLQSRPRAGAQRPGRALDAMDADRRRHLGVRARRAWCARRVSPCCSPRCCAPGRDDDDPGQARTLAALDRALSSGQRWAGFLDDLFRIPEAACNARRAFGRRRAARDQRSQRRERGGSSSFAAHPPVAAAGATRHTILPTSSATSSAPERSMATPTGRPCAVSSSLHKSRQHIDRLAARLAVGERHEDHLVAAARTAVPRSVQADKGAVAIALRHQLAVGERHPERRDVAAERVVRRDRLRHEIRPLRRSPGCRGAGRSSCTASRRTRRPSPT